MSKDFNLSRLIQQIGCDATKFIPHVLSTFKL